MKRFVTLEYHPQASRIRVVENDICQTLSQRMGTGGGNVPLILVIEDDERTDSIGVKSEPRNNYR